MNDKAIYQQVERVIEHKMYIAHGMSVLGGSKFYYPVAIESGEIRLRDADCGRAATDIRITTKEWGEARRLWRKVGFWDFVPEDEEAHAEIRFCHRDPQSAGRELYRLRKAEQADA